MATHNHFRSQTNTAAVCLVLSALLSRTYLKVAYNFSWVKILPQIFTSHVR
jgi:hypothetical protein